MLVGRQTSPQRARRPLSLAHAWIFFVGYAMIPAGVMVSSNTFIRLSSIIASDTSSLSTSGESLRGTDSLSLFLRHRMRF
ncbi:hypothetical protein R3P38DRAFT_3197876 [Favolaschia claudopus]|uniref:Uncharacterized protein n=1 Tax=Favolaschia claudopus TaxID=2862362 RepID=A0AAW0B5V9_9AGAR